MRLQAVNFKSVVFTLLYFQKSFFIKKNDLFIYKKKKYLTYDSGAAGC